MFLLAKIFNFFLQPGLWVGFLLLSGTVLLWTKWQRLGRWILTAVLTFIVLITVFPVGLLMLATLEDRFPVITNLSGPVDGIIVLGGSVNQLITKYRRQPSLTSGAERLTEFVVLAKKFPKAKLAFSGGSGMVFNQDAKETEVARQFFSQMGLDTSRVIFEDQSRNTFENAVYSYKLLSPKSDERWVLITSAYHMPRSMGVFRKAGWKPVAFPVDYVTRGSEQMTIGFDMIARFSSFGRGLRAWSGLIIYRMLGRMDTLFPAPVNDIVAKQ